MYGESHHLLTLSLEVSKLMLVAAVQVHFPDLAHSVAWTVNPPDFAGADNARELISLYAG
jgi:hypothetical protein